MKKPKGLKQTHTSNSPIGSGDYYGTGVKNPIGKSVRDYLNNPMKAKKMTPPKSMA